MTMPDDTAAQQSGMPEKPYAPSCDRNRDVILQVLRTAFMHRSRVLEIGSGTGQHAVHFARALPHLVWQCSDRADMLPGMRLWLDEAALDNLPPPLALDVAGEWPDVRFDALFTANTLHIMAWQQVEQLFAGAAGVLGPSATLLVYGPFNYRGGFTSDSNADFDRWLKARDPLQGIRDFEAVESLARRQGFALSHDIEMPANNRCLVFDR
ncbi:DUF938 domain-containing protein [Methyloversatilis thermotolerans]|uniref:DUF938 domain-containing protein n=1 Tax=Methyloversatilis thermotolerans TaxID=1346290 RepID=UPI00037E58E9|nr:DUF938 domain-containing protein [Methyloversatilis thermotolerans]